MATVFSTPVTPQISVEEYITRFVEGNEKPACEYVDGDLIPKAMGTKGHSKVQQNVQYSIRQKYEGRFDPLPELTTRLREREFLVPDVAVEDLSNPIDGRYPGPTNPCFFALKLCPRRIASVNSPPSANAITHGASLTAGSLTRKHKLPGNTRPR